MTHTNVSASVVCQNIDCQQFSLVTGERLQNNLRKRRACPNYFRFFEVFRNVSPQELRAVRRWNKRRNGVLYNFNKAVTIWPPGREYYIYRTGLRHPLHMYAFCAILIFYHLCEHASQWKAMIYQGSVWSPLCLCKVAAGFVALWHSDHLWLKKKTKKPKENKNGLSDLSVTLHRWRLINVEL